MLENLQTTILKQKDPTKPCVTVCLGTGCHAYESQAVYDAFKKEIMVISVVASPPRYFTAVSNRRMFPGLSRRPY